MDVSCGDAGLVPPLRGQLGARPDAGDAIRPAPAAGRVLRAVDRALTEATPAIWNSDQGSHFTSLQYTDRLQAAGAQISIPTQFVSRPSSFVTGRYWVDGRGCALDLVQSTRLGNIFTERLWRTVKYEEVYLHDYDSPREARQGLTRYFDFYDEERPHQSLDYLTPVQVYFGERTLLN